MARDTYYLIARNRDTNEMNIINFSKKINHNLEDIDHLTLKFSSTKDFAQVLQERGYIKDSNADIFIANKRKHNGTFLTTYETIYNSNRGRTNYLNNLINKTREGIKTNDEVGFQVFESFIARVDHYPAFKEVVLDTQNHIPEFLKNKIRANKTPHSFAEMPEIYTNGNIFENYNFYHNVIDFENTFDSLDHRTNPALAVSDWCTIIKKQNQRRSLVNDKLLGFISLVEDINKSTKDNQTTLLSTELEKLKDGKSYFIANKPNKVLDDYANKVRLSNAQNDFAIPKEPQKKTEKNADIPGQISMLANINNELITTNMNKDVPKTVVNENFLDAFAETNNEKVVPEESLNKQEILNAFLALPADTFTEKIFITERGKTMTKIVLNEKSNSALNPIVIADLNKHLPQKFAKWLYMANVHEAQKDLNLANFQSTRELDYDIHLDHTNLHKIVEKDDMAKKLNVWLKSYTVLKEKTTHK